jgi:hypothetical protein
MKVAKLWTCNDEQVDEQSMMQSTYLRDAHWGFGFEQSAQTLFSRSSRLESPLRIFLTAAWSAMVVVESKGGREVHVSSLAGFTCCTLIVAQTSGLDRFLLLDARLSNHTALFTTARPLGYL